MDDARVRVVVVRSERRRKDCWNIFIFIEFVCKNLFAKRLL